MTTANDFENFFVFSNARNVKGISINEQRNIKARAISDFLLLLIITSSHQNVELFKIFFKVLFIGVFLLDEV